MDVIERKRKGRGKGKKMENSIKKEIEVDGMGDWME